MLHNLKKARYVCVLQSERQAENTRTEYANEKKKYISKLSFYTFFANKSEGKSQTLCMLCVKCKQIVAVYNARELRSCIAKLREWRIDTMTFCWYSDGVYYAVLQLQAEFTEKLFTENSLVCVVCVTYAMGG